MTPFRPPLTAASVFTVVVLTVSYAIQVNGLDSRKLDESGGDQNEKCAPCGQTTPPPPPPSPPPPSPPPPACPPPPAPPALPPPSPKNPTKYCPPPPASLIYITGPPGGLYPIDQNYSAAGRRFQSGFLSTVAVGLLGLLVLGQVY